MHYYSDDGILNHTWQDRQLLVILSESLITFDTEEFSMVRSRCIDIACSIIHDYGIHSAMGGLGGCTTIDIWHNEVPDDKVKAALKLLFIEFIDAGYIVNEFKMAAFDAICEIQCTYLLDY